MDVLNTVVSFVLSAFSGWAIMSRCVRDGIIIKFGLALVSVGFLGAGFLGLDPGGVRPLLAAHLLVSLGLLICVGGYLLRSRKRGKHLRRASDWRNTV